MASDEDVEELMAKYRAWAQTQMSGDALEEDLEKLRIYLTSPPPHIVLGKLAVKGKPLLDVFSVGVKPKNNSIDDASWEIYGLIQAIDGQGYEYDLFDRPHHSPQSLFKIDSDSGGFLYLPLFDDGPFYECFPVTKVKVSLMDRVRELNLVQTTIVLDYKHFIEYDKILYENVETDEAILSMKYITYRAAVVADVQVLLNRIGKSGGNMAVSGSILASCHYNSSDFSEHPHGEKDCNCLPLIQFPNESAEVSLGEPLELSRSVLAVPSHSFLLIETALKVTGGEVFRDVAEFSAKDLDIDEKNVEGPNGLVYKVRVKWFHPYIDSGEGMEEAPSHEIESNKMGQMKRAKVLETQKASSIFPIYDRPLPLEFVGEDLMEVFSVFIGLMKDDEICSTYGSIEVGDTIGDFKVYDQDESHSDKFARGKTLSLQGPQSRCFAGSMLSMKIDLKDGGREQCKGYFAWNDGTFDKPWLNTRLCSVVKGEVGYAAVHYTLFSCAVQAQVRVFLSLTSPADHINISGLLAGEYSGNDYSTDFEREYYRSIHFLRSHQEPLLLPFRGHQVSIPISSSAEDFRETGIALPLTKSVVCVPKDSSLRIEVNLLVVAQTGNSKDEAQSLSKTVEFQVGRDTSWRIERQGHQIYMSVEWGHVHSPPEKKKSD